MKFNDIGWALGELARGLMRHGPADCDCHPRLAYRGPRRDVDPKPDGPGETTEDGDRRDTGATRP